MVSCTHSNTRQLYDLTCPNPSECVTFNVSDASGAEHPAGAPVFIVAHTGVSPIGHTNAEGLFLVPRSLLSSHESAALLFCWDPRSLACTAVRLDVGSASTYDWLNVTLPANRLIHRSQAHSAPSNTPHPR
jgi:hypothetical protein